MDEGFISGIMRSPHLPPNDVWFAGHSINYYYYAHFAIATLAKLLGQSPSIAFNTGISIFFGLTAVNLFGVTSNIVAWARHQRKQKQAATLADAENVAEVLPALLPAIPYGLLSMLMGLVFGNLAATQQWWQNHGESNALFRYDWFAPSRVITYLSPANGVEASTINEFPAFSFLLSCFHAHVLTLAFTIMAIGMGFNLLLEKDGRGLAAFGRGWRKLFTLGTTALVLGSLFAMNGWDFPTYLALALVCIGIQQWLSAQQRFSWSLCLDILYAGVCLVVLAFLLYAPFYLTFNSPAQGLGLVPPYLRSPLSSELLIYGLFVFAFLSLLLASVFKHPLFELQVLSVAAKQPENTVVVGQYDYSVVPLEGGSEDMVREDLSERVRVEEPDTSVTVEDIQAEQEPADVPADESAMSPQTSDFLWYLRLVLAGVYIMACIVVLKLVPNSATFVVGCSIAVLTLVVMLYNLRDRSLAFILFLGATSFALVAFCEIVFLKDAFANGDFERMNTVFKFYFQAWAMLSIASSAGVYFILESFRPVAASTFALRWSQRGAMLLWSVFMLALLAASMVYPLVAPYARYAQYDPQQNKYVFKGSSSLDGLSYLQTDQDTTNNPGAPGDYAAIRWLNANVQGDPVIVEAFGNDYTYSGRISAFTGLPTLMGWAGHEVQWRLNWLNTPANATDFNQRGGDVDAIYTNPVSAQVLSILARYKAQYIYVGALESKLYPQVNLHRFSAFMQVVYNANGVTIYKVK
jgi:uncharacterized membrane protein